LNIWAMKGRCPDAKVVSKKVLDNYRLVYKGGEDECAYLTIEEAEGYQVPVGVFEVSSDDIDKLDFYEGYPKLYDKCYIFVRIRGLKRKALIYIMREEFTYHIPSKNYINTCEIGYENFGFDKTILDEALAYSISNIPSPKKKIKEM